MSEKVPDDGQENYLEHSESYYAPQRPERSKRNFSGLIKLLGRQRKSEEGLFTKREGVSREKSIQFYHDVLRIIRESEGYNGEEGGEEILAYLEKKVARADRMERRSGEKRELLRLRHRVNEEREFLVIQIARLIKEFELETPSEDLEYPDIITWIIEKVVEQRTLERQVFEQEHSGSFVENLSLWKKRLFTKIEGLLNENAYLKQQIEELKTEEVEILDTNVEGETVGLIRPASYHKHVLEFKRLIDGLTVSFKRLLIEIPLHSPFHELVKIILEGRVKNDGLIHLKRSFDGAKAGESGLHLDASELDLWFYAKEKNFVFIVHQIARLYVIASMPHQVGSLQTDAFFEKSNVDRGALKSPFYRLEEVLSELFGLEILTVSLFRDTFQEAIHDTSPSNYSSIMSLFPELKNQLYTLEVRTIMDIDSFGLRSEMLGLNSKPHVYFTA